jgi:hypothetical protein
MDIQNYYSVNVWICFLKHYMYKCKLKVMYIATL